jgi:hypothetical protein
MLSKYADTAFGEAFTVSDSHFNASIKESFADINDFLITDGAASPDGGAASPDGGAASPDGGAGDGTLIVLLRIVRSVTFGNNLFCFRISNAIVY